MSDRIASLTRPIIGIENRTAQEAFDIMADRIRGALSTPTTPDEDVRARSRNFASLQGDNARMAQALRAVADAMLRGGDGAVGDFGWNITALNKARPLIRRALKEKFAFRPSEGEGLREAKSVAATLWRNLTDGDLRMARENCACLGFLLRTGRLPKWEELETAYGEMNAALTAKGER